MLSIAACETAQLMALVGLLRRQVSAGLGWTKSLQHQEGRRKAVWGPPMYMGVDNFLDQVEGKSWGVWHEALESPV